MSADYNKLFAAMSRDDLIHIWKRANVDLRSLTESEQLMAFIMKEHAEYHEVWNNYERYRAYEFDPETEVNPFLHVTLHHIVESQIRYATPAPVERVFQGLKDCGMSRSEAIHQIGAVLVEHLFHVLEDQKEFEIESYVTDLHALLDDVRRQS